MKGTTKGVRMAKTPKTRKGETILPDRLARAAPYDDVLALPADEQYEAAIARRDRLRQHPDHAAKEVLMAALRATLSRPEVRASITTGRLMYLFEEVVTGFVPGESVLEVLEPLHAFLSSRYGGGRPRKVDHEKVLRRRSALEQAWHPTPTQEVAREAGTSERNVQKILAKARKKKPG